jgi:glycosyltransferase involved in cell wall biosynthesis
MRIAINAADLDHSNIDGTRIYIWNLLKNFGRLDKDDRFLIYHKGEFNTDLGLPHFPNYEIIQKSFPFWWTQTRFSWEIFRAKPDVLFMPMHSLPFLRSQKTKTVVTIHDLAFKFFPNHFPRKDLRRLNWFTDYAVKNSDKIIAISNSTKNDLLHVYPSLKPEKIKVIYHGFDPSIFNKDRTDEQIQKTKIKYKIPYSKYIIFVGTIQPRKNIEVLLEAFKKLKFNDIYKDFGLVIAGCPGWMTETTIEKIKKTPGAVMTGKFKTKDLPSLLGGAEAFVLPSLYEGFGLPALEAMACGTPVIASKNSSLTEIVSDAGILIDPTSADELAQKLMQIIDDSDLKKELKEKGLARTRDFSWEKCAEETLEWLKQ